MNVDDVRAKREEVKYKIHSCCNCLLQRNTGKDIYMLVEGMSEKISEYMCCQICQRLMNALDDEGTELEYHCLGKFELNCYYFIKEYPFPNEILFNNVIITDMFNGYGTNIEHTKRLYKLVREFYECLPYVESRYIMITREMKGRKHQKQPLDCLSFNILHNILKYYERDENERDVKMITSELYKKIELQQYYTYKKDYC